MASNRLTFGQREGIEAIPSQLALREISRQLRVGVWSVIFQHMSDTKVDGYSGYNLSTSWQLIMRTWHTDYRSEFVDSFSAKFNAQSAIAKDVIVNADYVRFFNFLELILTHASSAGLRALLAHQLEKYQSAYRFIEGIIVPFASEHEAVAVKNAFSALSGDKFVGAKAHLKNSAVLLASGDYPDSIRESIHAVESVAIIIDGSSSTLGDALKKLDKSQRINSTFRIGVEKLYAYTNGENGIRHALIDDDTANVDENDALYMFGACASFVTYLIGKYKKSDLVK